MVQSKNPLLSTTLEDILDPRTDYTRTKTKVCVPWAIHRFIVGEEATLRAGATRPPKRHAHTCTCVLQIAARSYHDDAGHFLQGGVDAPTHPAWTGTLPLVFDWIHTREAHCIKILCEPADRRPAVQVRRKTVAERLTARRGSGAAALLQIVCTLGPKSRDVPVLEELLKAGAPPCQD
jgi:hypothetical protein